MQTPESNKQTPSAPAPSPGPAPTAAPVTAAALGLPKDLAAELAAADAVTAAEGMHPAAPGQPVAPLPPSMAEELAAILLVAGQTAGLVFPSVQPIYTETRCKATGAAVAPALERMGIKLPMGASTVYLGAIVAVVTLGWETRTAVMRDLARMQKEAEQAERERKAKDVSPEKTAAPAEAAAPDEPKRATEEDVLRPPAVAVL
ncbi:MAG: hypothetical protein ACK52V_16125 [Betaproteobacteria bacterium]|jgi:hypothetical protein